MKKALKLSLFTFAVSLFVVVSAHSTEQSIIGKWKTIDDDGAKVKSIVEIYEQEGEYFGKIIKLFRDANEDPDPVCEKCSDDDPRKAQPVKGMEIIKHLKKDGKEYSSGTVLDPNNGKVYDCKMWLEDGNLQVRGYIAFFFRTQTWLPAE